MGGNPPGQGEWVYLPRKCLVGRQAWTREPNISCEIPHPRPFVLSSKIKALGRKVWVKVLKSKRSRSDQIRSDRKLRCQRAKNNIHCWGLWGIPSQVNLFYVNWSRHMWFKASDDLWQWKHLVFWRNGEKQVKAVGAIINVFWTRFAANAVGKTPSLAFTLNVLLPKSVPYIALWGRCKIRSKVVNFD